MKQTLITALDTTEKMMKIRNGFVSNSSSSSFILVGLITYKSEKAAAIIEAIGIDEKADDIDYELTKHGFDGGYGGYKNANGITLFMSDSDICCWHGHICRS